MKALLPVVLTIILLSGIAYAKDHEHLEKNLPAELDDAYPTDYRAIEAHLPARWERLDDGADRVVLFPRLEAGIFLNTEFSIEVPVLMGDADRTGSGDIETEISYNFITEGMYVPAVSIAGGVRAPSGKNSDITETTVAMYLTKAVLPTSLYHYLHVNVLWKHLIDEDPSKERNNRLKVAAGYSQRLGSETLLVADYVFEQSRRDGEDENFVEVGIRYQLSPRWIAAAGAGAGLDSDSADYRIMSGLQYTY